MLTRVRWIWVLQRLGFYARAMRESLHFKYVLVNFVCRWLPDFASGVIRARTYRLAGFDIAPHCAFGGNLRLTSGLPGFYDKLHVGAETVIAPDVTINLDDNVYVGSRVSVSPDVRIYTGTHQLGPGSKRMSASVFPKPVRIEDGCWLGVGAMILPGITIGRGSVIAAGSVVTRDIPPDSYAEGNPARVVRTLPWSER